VTATSSNPALIPNPTVSYTSPNSTGSLSFTPVAKASGIATITVTVTDDGTTNNTVSRSFTVTVNGRPWISAITNQLIAINTSTPWISFTVGDPDGSASNLVVWAESSSPALIPTNNIAFGGSGSNRTVRLTPLANQSGTATITVTVSDGLSSASTNFQLTVLAPPPPPSMLTIVLNGNGSISPDLNGQQLVIGERYTLTAIPGPDSLFAGWSGSIASASPTISFVMQPNMYLQANFVPNPFVPAQGAYNGLFYETNEVRMGRSGFFSLKLTSRGNYSGKLNLGGQNYSFRGTFSPYGLATNQLKRANQLPLILELRLSGAGGNELEGRLTDGNWVAQLAATRSPYNVRSNPAPQAGLYTLVLPGQTNRLDAPHGCGYGTVRVDASGRINFAAALADGTRVSQSALMDGNGQWPLYALPSGRSGQLLSWITFANRSDSDLSGDLSWIRLPVAFARYYAAGFTRELEAIGSQFTPPGTNWILRVSHPHLQILGGNVGDLTLPLAAGPRPNQLVATNLTVKFKTANGLFSGKLLDPGSGRPWSFNGVVLQKLNAGHGCLLGTNLSSQVNLLP
ncbi:MAG: Ig-like domain-containing protein, partial [Verrucomicrobiae bacterium]|nr:Ig-like domain-containing protein [Verrucomicrobiae bacterium]